MADSFSTTVVLGGAVVSRALQPSSTDRPAVAPASESDGAAGNFSPRSGERLPPDDKAMMRDLADAVARLNEILGAAERSVRFRIDESSGKTLIYVVNASTGEIVRQIPAEQVLVLARRFGAPGALIDAQV